MKWVLMGLARFAARRYGYDIFTSADVARLQAEAEGLLKYADESGHLTQAYRAGKTVRHRADAMARTAGKLLRESPLRLREM